MAGEGRLMLLWSPETRRELEKILRNIKATPEFLVAVERLLLLGTNVGRTERLTVIKDDPDDNKFLACARAGSADYIITNDDHLLALEIFDTTRIVTPKVFLEDFSKRQAR